MIFKNREVRDPRKTLFASINHAKFNIMTISEGKRYVAKRQEKTGVAGVGKGESAPPEDLFEEIDHILKL